MLKQRYLVHLKIDALELRMIKNSKKSTEVQKVIKLRKESEPGFQSTSQPNFKAATSLKTKVVALKT